MATWCLIGALAPNRRSASASRVTVLSRTQEYSAVPGRAGERIFQKGCPHHFSRTLSAPDGSFRGVPDRVARFIYDRAHLFPNGDAKWKAFEPSRRDNSTSVFITDGLTLLEVWQLAQSARPLPIVAEASVTPASVHAVGLELQVDNTPPRHAAITNWPEEKPEMKQVAMDLASRAVVRRP